MSFYKTITLRFRVISVRSGNNSLVFGNHENFTTKCCVYDAAWPHDGNYISWDTAVCTYPHFVSDDFAETISLGRHPISPILTP